MRNRKYHKRVTYNSALILLLETVPVIVSLRCIRSFLSGLRDDRSPKKSTLRLSVPGHNVLN